jgi:hypothetical protein
MNCARLLVPIPKVDAIHRIPTEKSDYFVKVHHRIPTGRL